MKIRVLAVPMLGVFFGLAGCGQGVVAGDHLGSTPPVASSSSSAQDATTSDTAGPEEIVARASVPLAEVDLPEGFAFLETRDLGEAGTADVYVTDQYSKGLESSGDLGPVIIARVSPASPGGSPVPDIPGAEPLADETLQSAAGVSEVYALPDSNVTSSVGIVVVLESSEILQVVGTDTTESAVLAVTTELVTGE